MEAEERLYDKYRTLMVKTTLWWAIIVFFVELGIFLLDYAQQGLEYPVGIYTARFLFIPSIINFILAGIGYQMNKSTRFSSQWKNHCICWLMFGISACVVCIHYFYGTLFCSPCLVICVSIFFNDIKLTKRITLASFLCVTVATIFGKLELRHDDPVLFRDWIIILVIIEVMYLVAKVFSRFESERMRLLGRNYEEKLRLKEQLKYEALTGLYNRSAIFQILEQRVYECNEDETLFFFMFDLDDFKKVNDQYGHPNGDKVLIKLAECLKEYKQSGAAAGRMGGEEFALILPGVDSSEALQIGEKILETIRNSSFSFMKENDFVTLSCGIAKYQSAMTAEQMFENADKALYRAKNSGKNQVIMF